MLIVKPMTAIHSWFHPHVKVGFFVLLIVSFNWFWLWFSIDVPDAAPINIAIMANVRPGDEVG